MRTVDMLLTTYKGGTSLRFYQKKIFTIFDLARFFAGVVIERI